MAHVTSRMISEQQLTAVPVRTTEIVWRDYHDRVRAFIARRVNAQDVDDLTQDVFLRIHRNMTSAQAHPYFDAWIFRIARNVIIDHYRKQSVVQKHEVGASEAFDEVIDESIDELPPSDIPADLLALIENLPDSYRETLILAALQGEPHGSIAKRLGVSDITIRTRVHRGRKLLQAMFLDRYEIEFDRHGLLLAYQPRELQPRQAA